jgi:hypothetical protein
MYGSRGCTGRPGALCQQNCILAGTGRIHFWQSIYKNTSVSPEMPIYNNTSVSPEMPKLLRDTVGTTRGPTPIDSPLHAYQALIRGR